jgi:hypothetical protein
MTRGTKRQAARHLVGPAGGVPADVCGIDRDQAVHQARREPTDAALGKVGLEHRRPEGLVAPAGGDRGADLEADCCGLLSNQ